MSAFLSSDKTINKIATKVFYGRDYDWIKCQLKDLGIDTVQEFGNALYKMNCESLGQRYGDKEFSEYKFTLDGNHQAIDVFKSLESYIYQCSEGSVIYTKLYKLMLSLELSMAKRIIGELEEYKRYSWN